MPERRLDADLLRDWAQAAVAELMRHADEINRLNVFPVADADTGTNLLFTMRAAAAEASGAPSPGAEASGAPSPGAETYGPWGGPEPGGVAGVAAALARGAASGARGNSGMILSQVLRAVAEVTADSVERTAEIDAVLLGATLRHAVALVVEAMGGEVVAGTAVSVLQAAATAVEHCAGDRAGLAEALLSAGDAAADALDRTPSQLAVLAEAGVVDAGGRGLLVLLDTLTEAVTGHRPVRPGYLPAREVSRPQVAGARPPQFEVMYLVSDCAAGAADQLRVALDRLGDSVALAPEAPGRFSAPEAPGRFSVHLHTDDAGAAIEAGLAAGAVSRIRISALATGRSAPGGWTRRRAVLAVVDGDGAAQLFGAEGACVVRPPAELVDPVDGVGTDQLLRALIDTGAAGVMVLPNGYVAAGDLVAACTAAIGWGVDAVPLPSGSMVQGLAALAVHDPGRQAVDDGYAMARVAAGVRHGAVRIATENASTWAGPCAPGDGLGISGDEVVVVDPDPRVAAARLIDLLLGAGGELVTVLVGAAAQEPDTLADAVAEHVRRRHPGVEFARYRTGHRGDLLLIGVE